MFLLHLFALCNACVNALVIVLSDGPFEEILKEGRLLIHIYPDHLWQELPHYLVHLVWQFLRLCWHIQIMGRQYQRRETVGKKQHWQKEIVIHWGLFQKIIQYCRTGDSGTEYSSWRLFPQKLVNMNFTDPNIHSRAATDKPLITESTAQMRKQWCRNHKTWTSDNCSCPLCSSLHQEEFHPGKPTIQNVLLQ
jgi:hypothetical protein